LTGNFKTPAAAENFRHALGAQSPHRE